MTPDPLSDSTPATAAPPLTVTRLRNILADWPGETEVFVNATDRDGTEVFAAVKDVSFELTCDDSSICRLLADQEDDDD